MARTFSFEFMKDWCVKNPFWRYEFPELSFNYDYLFSD